MAGVGDSVVVSRGGIDEDLLALGKDEQSLQELIDSELALRISRAQEDQTMSVLDNHSNLAKSTFDFLKAETLHTRLCLDDRTNDTNITNPVSDTPETDSDWTTVEEMVSRMNNPAAINDVNEINHNDIKFSEISINSNVNSTNSVCINNNYNNVSVTETFTTTKKTSEIILETKTISTTVSNDDYTVNTTEQQHITNNHNEEHIDFTENHEDHVMVNHLELVETADEQNHNDNVLVESLNDIHVDQVDRLIHHDEAHQAVRTHQSNHIISEEVKETTEKKSKKKKTTVENGDAVVTKTKKKKSKKSDEKENHISVKSSFSKFDQLSKKTILHVRSSDPAKAQKTFSQGGDGDNPICKSCGKTVFAMEQIKAERAVWHKNCFRCHTCSKQLTIDIYSSHEGELYCKPHFRELFTPKAVVESDEPVRRRKPEMIIRENQPIELPPDVVRASDKPDLGLEELSSLNVKSKFQVFEKGDSNQDDDKGPTKVDVKRSPSILSKLAKFQKRGMDVGVTDQDLDGFVYEESSSEEEQEEEEDEETGVIKCRKIKEKPMSFGKMDDVKKNWESGATRREEMLEQKRQDLQNLRSRLFMGKQVKMKEMYEQAVAESEGKISKKESDVVRSDKAKAFREKFEKGEVTVSDEEIDDKAKNIEDLSVFEEGISKKSRSLFLEMDAKVQSTPPPPVKTTPPIDLAAKAASREVYMNKRQISEDIVRSSDKVEDVTIETADVSSKFKFFEKYKAPEKEKRKFRITPPREGQVKSDSPEREVYRDPTVVRSEDKVEEDEAVKRSQTASKMLSIFRQMEEHKPNIPDGPKPKKEFTPPPDFRGVSSSEEESEEESEEDEESEDEEDGVIKSSHKIKDEFLGGSTTAARAKDLAAKFESWEPERQSGNNAVVMLDSEQPSLESTKSLRAHFESLKSQKKEEESKSKPRVNRFVQEAPTTSCSSCDSKVYPLEKIETDGKVFHKQCFRCSHCKCILRMDSYTLNNGNLYCLAHFKQLFISKGNYDEGFGVDQHKRKWEVNGTAA